MKCACCGAATDGEYCLACREADCEVVIDVCRSMVRLAMIEDPPQVACDDALGG